MVEKLAFVLIVLLRCLPAMVEAIVANEVAERLTDFRSWRGQVLDHVDHVHAALGSAVVLEVKLGRAFEAHALVKIALDEAALLVEFFKRGGLLVFLAPRTPT